MTDIAAWLDTHGLSKYADIFAENEIELSDLSELTEVDLKEMGLPLGPRKRVLKAVRDATAPAPKARLPAHEPQGQPTISGERRQLTVMFVDLVGSTALSEALDPEDLAEVLRQFKEGCAAAVAAFDGHIANYMGDGVMVFFGYPRAHEDDAERAIRAGLQILRDIPAIRTHAELKVRVGIATGLVVVGDLRGEKMSEDGTAMGGTPNLAARLETMAETGTLIVAPATRHLAGDAFEYVERGSLKLKGFKDEVRAWQVTGVRKLDSRFMAGHSTMMSRLVGRTVQCDTMREKWIQAQTGNGQVVLVSGEAGIGKSRLIEELRLQVGDDACAQLRYQCSPYHDSSTFYPVIRQLERASGLERNDPDDVKLDKLAKTLRDPSDDALKLAAALLSVPFEHRLGPLDLSPQQVMAQTLEMLVSRIVAVPQLQPILLLFEDAHWIDPTTKILLDRIIDRVQDAAVLMVVSFRPSFEPGWGLRSNLTNLALTQLDHGQVQEIVDELTAGKPVPPQIYELISTKTNGIPLYIEEVTKDLLESGLLTEEADRYRLAGPLPTLAVPSTLQDSLMARLDRLSEAKEVAQTGAVFGLQFSYRMLEAMTLFKGADLRRNLDLLTEAGIIVRSGTGAAEVFSYRHTLIRDTAYNSLLKSERQSIHAQVAGALRNDPVLSTETEHEIIAYHYTMARQTDEAVEHWHLAGRRAVERSANVEAITHLAQATEQLEHLPQTDARDRREIEIQVLRAGVLRSTAGIAADDTGQTYGRIRDLCQRVGQTKRLFPVLNGLYAFHLVRAEYNLARDVARQLLDLAAQSGETQHRMVSQRAMGAVLLHIGQLRPACDHLEQALALYGPAEHGRMAFVYGTDHAAITSGFLSMAVWMLGKPDRALEIQMQAVRAAEDLKHAHSVAQALTYLCMLHLLRREVDKTREVAERLARLSEEHSFAFMAQTATFWKSWADAFEAPNAATIEAMRVAAEAWWSGGAGNYKPFFLTLLAEVTVRAGDPVRAEALLTSAREFQALTNEGWAQAETDRVATETNLALGLESDGYLAALQSARRQHARMFELRAAVAAGETTRAEFSTILAQIEGGEETGDVQAARAVTSVG